MNDDHIRGTGRPEGAPLTMADATPLPLAYVHFDMFGTLHIAAAPADGDDARGEPEPILPQLAAGKQNGGLVAQRRRQQLAVQIGFRRGRLHTTL